ncbi:MAG: enoyl-CoA hydratase/isomerase family protein [Gammaproteobacteria bacterium]|nr:enoyl-CoA hydratase/isomerase family protein [Gammaproteobacteria bacterium]
MPYTMLLTEKHDRILTLTINRPEVHNALNTEAWRELRAAVADARSDPEVGVVIITGAGHKSFVAGADVGFLAHRTPMDVLAGEPGAILAEIENLEKPVIAAVNGYALGGGCELALACDIRIASENAQFGQPEVNLGILPGGGGTQRLPRLIGMGRAKELIFTGEIIGAHEAERIGLVNRVVPQAQLIPAAREMCRRILAKSCLAVRVAKTVMNAGVAPNLHAGLLMERLGQTLLFGSEDRTERMNAFLEKRVPAAGER